LPEEESGGPIGPADDQTVIPQYDVVDITVRAFLSGC